MSYFTRCLAPGRTPEQLARGKAAAAGLLELFRTIVRGQDVAQAEGLLADQAGDI